MARAAIPLVRHLRKVLEVPVLATRTDRELLETFAQRRDEAAFAALVRRHGPMVHNVCRHILRHDQDAEDAFQAVFLVLARKAQSLGSVASVAGWLHGVAHRTALAARRTAARRRAHANRTTVIQPEQPSAEAALHELQALLDTEVARLPEKWRSPFVLCCLEGHSKAEAARELGWKEGTVSSRLAQARERLRSRLMQRGVTLSAALAAIALAPNSSSAALSASIAQAGLQFAGGSSPPGPAAILAREILHSMTATPTKLAALLLALACVTGGLSLVAARNEDPVAPQVASQLAPSSEPAAEKEDSKPVLDAFGDPLPPGAIARLGSLRFYHGRTVRRVVLSPDGKWLVSQDDAGSRLWDARTGKESVLADGLKQATFFATEDRLIAVKVEDGRMVVYDVGADKEVTRLPQEASVGSPVGLSPDGNTLVWLSYQFGAGVRGSKLTFADAVRGTVRHVVDVKEGKHIWSFAFSADGKMLATHYADNSIEVWDVKSHSVVLSVVLKSNALGHLGLSPDGKILAAAVHGEKQIRFWDVPTKKEIAPLAIEPGRAGSAVAFSADGKFLAVSYEAQVGLWDLAKRKEIRRLKGKEAGLSCPVFSRDGKRLAAGDGNGISLWDLATGQPCHDFGHIYSVDALAFSPDGKTIASGAAYTDNVVRTWDPITGQIKARWHGHKDGIEVIAYSPDGKLVASGSQDGTVRLWDASTGKEAGCLDAKDGMIYAMAFAPDGKTLASGGKRKVVHLWNVAACKEIRAIDNPGGLTLRLAFSPDGKLLTTRGFDEGMVLLWDLATGKELRSLDGLKAGCPQLSFAPLSRTLAVNCDDGTVRLFDATTGREVRSLGEPLQPGQFNRCLGVTFAPDGRSLAAGYDDGTVRVWEMVSGRERLRLRGHLGVALGLAYSPDGSLLVSGSSDHTALVWDLAGQRTAERLKSNLTRADADRLWRALADADPGQAYAAMKKLRANPEQSIVLFKERLQPVASAEPKEITKLIADLDSDEFNVRENATKKLREMADLAESALQSALNQDPSPEARHRIRTLLRELAAANSPALLRGVRAVEVLELIGIPEARKVLRTLADGASNARLTQEAKATLARQANPPEPKR
jgi:RNA polymerase sigma factor (sigma-70 family)